MLKVVVNNQYSTLNNFDNIQNKMFEFARENGFNRELKVVIMNLDNANKDENYVSFVNGKIQDDFLF